MKTNEVMRLGFLGYNLATEVVLSGKSGRNEVFKPCRINNNKNKPSNI
jgi:hypothetical protein